MPSDDLSRPIALYLLSTGPHCHTTFSVAAVRVMRPLSKFWARPSFDPALRGTRYDAPVAQPGAPLKRRCMATNASPVVSRTTTLNKVSLRPSTERISHPSARAVLRAPTILTPPRSADFTTVTRPEIPSGSSTRKRSSRPVPNAAFNRSENALQFIVTFHLWFGLAETSSAGSDTPRR